MRILDDTEVTNIKLLYHENPERFTPQWLANQYGVAYQTISAILTGHNWPHIRPDLTVMPRQHRHFRPLIQAMLADDNKPRDIAAVLRCSLSLVYKVKYGKR